MVKALTVSLQTYSLTVDIKQKDSYWETRFDILLGVLTLIELFIIKKWVFLSKSKWKGLIKNNFIFGCMENITTKLNENIFELSRWVSTILCSFNNLAIKWSYCTKDGLFLKNLLIYVSRLVDTSNRFFHIY